MFGQIIQPVHVKRGGEDSASEWRHAEKMFN